jgi:RNA polymerase-binding transcription factor DksA
MNKSTFTRGELRAFHTQLQELEARLTGKVSELEAEALRPSTLPPSTDEAPAHEADPATRVAEDAVAITLLESEEQVLDEVRKALARFDAGSFAKCERCGHMITRTRLRAVPYARYCIRCAHDTETGASG